MAGSVKLLTPSGGSVTIDATDTASALSLTLPATNDNIITANTTQTLTNKTLTNPVINGFTGNTSAITIGTTQFVKDASGNIGIGTSSPSFPNGTGLAVYNSTVPRIKLANSTTGDTATDGTQLLVSGSDFYIQQREAASVIITTNGSDRVTIDASGNLGLGRVTNANYRAVIRGIGTSSSTAGLVVENGVGTETFFLNDSGNLGLGVTPSAWWASGKAVQVGAGAFLTGTTTASQMLLGANYYYNGTNNIYIASQQASYYQQLSGVHSWNTATSGTAGNAITFGDPKMTLDASGNLLVGTTSQLVSERFNVTGPSASSGAVASFNVSTNTSGYNCIRAGIGSNGNNTSTYFFWGNNSISNYYLYGNGTSSFTSDSRVKKNIETTRDGYLADLNKLRVVKYNWINHADDAPKELGLIAQEVEQIFPGMVQESTEDNIFGFKPKVLKGSILPFMLLKAIQELSAQNKALEDRLAKLEAK